MKVKILAHEGLTIPVIFCELCDKPITKDQQAEYLIPDTPEGEYSDVIVGHSRCTKAYEDSQKELTMGNMSIGHLLYCLVANTGIDIEKEKETNDLLAQIR